MTRDGLYALTERSCPPPPPRSANDTVWVCLALVGKDGTRQNDLSFTLRVWSRKRWTTQQGVSRLFGSLEKACVYISICTGPPQLTYWQRCLRHCKLCDESLFAAVALCLVAWCASAGCPHQSSLDFASQLAPSPALLWPVTREVFSWRVVPTHTIGIQTNVSREVHLMGDHGYRHGFRGVDRVLGPISRGRPRPRERDSPAAVLRHWGFKRVRMAQEPPDGIISFTL